MSPTNLDVIGRLVNAIIPDAATRDLCLPIFSDSLSEAQTFQYNWIVHCSHKEKRVRLQVGHTRVAVLERGRFTSRLTVVC